MLVITIDILIQIHQIIHITRNQISKKLHSDLVLLPSSIHESIILPHNNDMSFNAMTEMVNSVNETSVSDEEILSDHVYFYDSKSKRLIIPD